MHAFPKSTLAFATLAALGLAVQPASAQTTTFSVPLTMGAGNKYDVGMFAAGATINLTVTGSGDLVDSRFQTNPDGSLYAPAAAPYDFANPGAAYSSQYGGDGINHFAGGGANFDATGTGFPFAGKNTTDTTDPADIRLGALVGTFTDTPTANSSDWFYVGNGGLVTVPIGAHLYLAVNDTANSDNHGSYSVMLTSPAPEPSQWAAFDIGLLGLGALAVKARKRSVA